MGEKKKMGRPTDNPKEIPVKFRSDKATYERLKICSVRLGLSQSEIMRRGINRIFDDLEKE